MKSIRVLQLTGDMVRFLSKIQFLPQTPKTRCPRRSKRKFPVWPMTTITTRPKGLWFLPLHITSNGGIAAGVAAVTVPMDSKKRKNDLQIMN